MADTFANVKNQINPADRWYQITPSNDNDLPILPRAVICSGDGTLVAIDAQGNSMTLNLIEGVIIAIRPTRVGEASTGSFYAAY